MLKGDDILYNADTDAEEKPGKLYTMCGNKPSEVPELFAGDIGAIAKLDEYTVPATPFPPRRHRSHTARTDYSIPYTYMRYSSKE